MKKQSGFAVVELVLGLIIVAVLGFAGWYVWNNQQTPRPSVANTTQEDSTVSRAVPNSLRLSSSPTFYDCMDQVGAHDSEGDPSTSTVSPQYHYDSKTGTCTMLGKTYPYPTTYSDDIIRAYQNGQYHNAKNLQLNDSEVSFIRSVAKIDIKTCNVPVNGQYVDYAAVIEYGEAGGKYLYYDVGCDSGYRAVAVQQNGSWTVPYKGQDIIACDTITKYRIPHSLFNADNTDGMKAQCFAGPNGSGQAVDINSL